MSTLTTVAATHGTACRAYAIGSAADNIRHAAKHTESAAWAADADPITEGDGYLTDGLTACRCDLDADDLSSGEANLIVVGMALLDLAVARGAVAPDPAQRTVASLWCAECGTETGPFVVSTQTDVCLPCHVALTTVHQPADTAPLVSREQAEEWAGEPLTDDLWERLDAALPHSSVPEAIATIVDGLRTT